MTCSLFKTALHKQCASLGILGARMQRRTAPTLGACWDVARVETPGGSRRVAIQAGCSQLDYGHAFFTYTWYYRYCTVAGIFAGSSVQQEGKPVGSIRGWQRSSSVRSNFSFLSKRHVDDGYCFRQVMGKEIQPSAHLWLSFPGLSERRVCCKLVSAGLKRPCSGLRHNLCCPAAGRSALWVSWSNWSLGRSTNFWCHAT